MTLSPLPVSVFYIKFKRMQSPRPIQSHSHEEWFRAMCQAKNRRNLMEKSRDFGNDRQLQPASSFNLDFRSRNKSNQTQYQQQSLVRSKARQIMAKSVEALVMAYVAANLDDQQTPLKDFLASLEKKLLLTCLRLTHGNQKNAAAILGIKPTVIFEKMRKYGIGRQNVQLGSEWTESLLEMAEQDLASLEMNAATGAKPLQEQPIWQNDNRRATITSQIG